MTFFKATLHKHFSSHTQDHHVGQESLLTSKLCNLKINPGPLQPLTPPEKTRIKNLNDFALSQKEYLTRCFHLIKNAAPVGGGNASN